MLEKLKFLTSKSTKNFRIIILGFMGVVLLGAFLLMLPISSQSRQFTPFGDALFTAISTTCVTGLVVQDTATYWSAFGHAVIITLIQIGGMGVITIGIMLARASKRKIGLSQRSIMQESISAHKLGGIVNLTGFILKYTIIIEFLGALLLAPVFCRDFGVLKGIWYSFFHSISAFCNAGFDLMGVREKFSSLCTYSANIYFNVIIMLLIIVGGISFMTWNDVKSYKLNIKRYSLQSKLILITSLVLIFMPAIYFFFGEYKGLPMSERIVCSFFQSVTTRTAGFNTTDLAAMNESGTLIMIALMMIGGAPGSTAGGMKVTTIAVLFLSARTVFSRGDDIKVLKRRIAEDAVRVAGAILFMYITLSAGGAIVISRIEHLPLLTCWFETGSAIGTAGLTLGITSSLGGVSKAILMFLMFFGRVGGLTLIYAAVPQSDAHNSRLPLEKVNVG